MLTTQSISIRKRSQTVEAELQVEATIEEDLKTPEQVIKKFHRLIMWQFQRSGIPDEETDEVLAEVNLYMAEQWHRYDPSKSQPQTFLAWQVRGAIRRWQRREGRYNNRLDDTITINEEGQEEDILESLPDVSQADGRDVEAQIIMRDNLMAVLRIAKERGIKVNLNSTRMTQETKDALREIWSEVTGERIDVPEKESEKKQDEQPVEPPAVDGEAAERVQHRCPVCNRFMTIQNPTCKVHGPLAEAQAEAERIALAKNPRWRPRCPICGHMVSPKTRMCKVHGPIDAPADTDRPGQPRCSICGHLVSPKTRTCKAHGPIDAPTHTADHAGQPKCPICNQYLKRSDPTCKVHGPLAEVQKRLELEHSRETRQVHVR